MHDASPEFAATIRGDYQVAELVEFILPEGNPVLSFDVVDSGDYQLDSTANIRHNGSFKVQASDVSPAVLRGALEAPGLRCRYSRGLVRLDGERELKTVLTGEVATGQVSWSRDGIEALPITVFDSYTRLEWPAAAAFAVPPGRNYVTAIVNIITQFVPHIEWGNVMTTQFVTPALAFATDTHIADVGKQMAEAIGAELFFDAFNRMNIEPVPVTFGRSPVWTFDCDAAGSGITKITSKVNNDRIPNGVVVIGQHSSGGTVTGTAMDDKQGSRTFLDGEFGKRVIIERTEKVITQKQANAMAAGLLEKVLGGSQEIIIEIVPNPLLVLGDICTVISSRFDINDTFIIRAISGGAGRASTSEPMVVTLRRGVNPTTGIVV